MHSTEGLSVPLEDLRGRKADQINATESFVMHKIMELDTYHNMHSNETDRINSPSSGRRKGCRMHDTVHLRKRYEMEPRESSQPKLYH